MARTTRDVDIVVAISEVHGGTFFAALAETDLYVPLEAAREALTSGGSFNVLDSASGGKVDVFANGFDVAYLRTWATELGVEADLEDLIHTLPIWWQNRSPVQLFQCPVECGPR